jgi:uncharacterized protein
MKPVFADTGYWIGLLDPRDALHEQAWTASEEYETRGIVTSHAVLTELLNDFGSRNQFLRVSCAQFVEELTEQAGVRIIPQTPELFEQAFDLYKNRPDKSWSLTDCASFVICEQEGITEALAYDQHFRQAGIKPLLRS